MTVAAVRLPGGGRAIEKRVAASAAEGAAERLVWEGECLLALAGVPGVVRCVHLDRTTPVLLLEYAAAGSLAGRLARGASPGVGRLLPAREVVSLGTALAATLAAVHAAGLVHRDVKPSNVLLRHADLTRADAACLADFGVAARTGTRGSLGDGWTEEAVGTLGYAAPEQLADPATAVHPAADVYSLGVVFYELATGRLPHELAPGEDECALRARIVTGATPARPTAYRADLGTAIAHVLLDALAFAPMHRPTAATLGVAWREAWAERSRTA